MDNQQTQQNLPSELSEEEQEIARLREALNKSPKLSKWLELFLDQSNPKTYGNKTESAMQAYDCKSRHDAGNIGYQNYKKLGGIASMYLETKGVTAGKLLDVAVAKLYESKNGGGKEWWETIATLTGVKEPNNAQILVQNNTQVNNYDLNAPEVKDFNKKFEEFLNAES